MMGRRRRRSHMALLVACGLSVSATFALILDIADPGPRRAIITVCLVVAAATIFQVWHTARTREVADAIAAEALLIREHLVETHYSKLKSDSDH